MPDRKGYDTQEEAVMAAMSEALPLSKEFEYAGVIYQVDDKYYYTVPETSKQTHDVKVKVRYPKGSKLLGLYHTHPEGDKSNLFSDNDISVAEQLKLPYYMGHSADNSINVFTPGKSAVQTSRSRLMGKQRFSTGELLSKLEADTQQHEEAVADGRRILQARQLIAKGS